MKIYTLTIQTRRTHKVTYPFVPKLHYTFLPFEKKWGTPVPRLYFGINTYCKWTNNYTKCSSKMNRLTCQLSLNSHKYNEYNKWNDISVQNIIWLDLTKWNGNRYKALAHPRYKHDQRSSPYWNPRFVDRPFASMYTPAPANTEWPR